MLPQPCWPADTTSYSRQISAGKSSILGSAKTGLLGTANSNHEAHSSGTNIREPGRVEC